MTILSLSSDELLTTTRAVRRFLDLTRPVEREVVVDCIRIAQQAPTAGNLQNVHFLVVTDPTQRARLAELWRRGMEASTKRPLFSADGLRSDDPQYLTSFPRILASCLYLAEHLHEVPVHVIPCVLARTEGASTMRQSAIWGSLLWGESDVAEDNPGGSGDEAWLDWAWTKLAARSSPFRLCAVVASPIQPATAANPCGDDHSRYTRAARRLASGPGNRLNRGKNGAL